MRENKLFNNDWVFTNQEVHTPIEKIISNQVVWESVDIPHDWIIYNTHNLYDTSEGWYKKSFYIDDLALDEKFALRFEGIYMDSTVFINQKQVFEWKYGYSTFEFDITDFVHEGENEIIVRALHQCPNSRWYAGAGIYRNIWLKRYSKTHIVSDGVYISTRKETSGWVIHIDSEIESSGKAFTLKQTIFDQDHQVVLTSESSNTNQELIFENPKLWDIDEPNLYLCKTELMVDGEVIDLLEQKFGFRTLRFDPNEGFFLNEKWVKIHGVCQHHDLGCLGAAVNKEAIRRQLKILKGMGVNAIRTSHNMFAVEFFDLADEMGIMVDSESFDMWERPKTEYDYARFFKEWASKDVASWIRRDRNHPSIIMWTIGNEIYDTHADERGQVLTRKLIEMVEKYDYRKNAPITIGSNFMPWENARKCADIVKLAGYNYGEKYYDEHHKMYPDWVIYGSETSSTVQSRGIYHFPLSQSVLADDDEQCSALGNSSTSWGAKNTEACIIDDRDASYSPGQFLWSGFDYIGEPTPYHTKNSYFGQVDTAGFPKDSYYIYKAEWTDYKKDPFVHVFPYWDFNEGQMIDVRVCSNAPKIELFFQDRSIGTYDIDHKSGKQLLGNWQIPYQKGVLKAVAYDEKGNMIATEERASFGEAKEIVLKPDKQELLGNGQDLIFVEISMIDEDGNAVENANNRVEVKVNGTGRLMGLDNGDSTDFDQYKTTSRKLFSGKLLAIVGSKKESGKVEIEVSSKGLETKKLYLNALFCECEEGVAAESDIVFEQCSDEIPVRKISIVSEQGNKFNEKLTEMHVFAELYPKNATYHEVEWRVTNDAGIDSNIAVIEPNGKEVVVKALGDGCFRLRCMTRNGDERIHIISQLEFEVTGLGEANLNPYQMISGGLYTDSMGTLTNGNERGVATPRDGDSYVGFQGIDFGEYGSDEITIPIFSLDSEQLPIEIWEGVPGAEGSELIGDVTYQKPSIWNHYQEETYKLTKRLKGITSIYFLLRKKIHIKGFWFTKLDKAYQTLFATECNHIYGDTFNVTDSAIEGIGNNVSLVYENMDFSEKGFSRLTICGHSPIEKNTIHVRFEDENGEIKQIAEFLYSDDYEERRFDLESVNGIKTVTFVFMPGSNFDFKWFRFER